MDKGAQVGLTRDDMLYAIELAKKVKETTAKHLDDIVTAALHQEKAA